jgi:ketosteroid isomerase-like protein
MKNSLLKMRVARSIRSQPAIPGSACVSHAGDGVLAIADFSKRATPPSVLKIFERLRRDAATSTRDACGTQSSTARALFLSASILVAWTAAWSASAALAREQADHTSAVSEIRSVLRMQQDAWNNGDIDGFMNGYARSASTVFISEDTVRRGWEKVRDRYREKHSDRAKMGILTFSDLEITPLSRDWAVALGRWKLKRVQDQPHGRFTLIFRRFPEGWRIVHDHTSAAPPSP